MKPVKVEPSEAPVIPGLAVEQTAKLVERLETRVRRKVRGSLDLMQEAADAIRGLAYDLDIMSKRYWAIREEGILLRQALPIIRRAATEEARSNRAPTGLPRRTEMQDLLTRVEALLSKAER
jgi:hypothetical protein